MPGRDTTSPAVTLRSALLAPWPEVRRAASRVLRRAYLRHDTVAATAAELEVSRDTIERLRRDFPDVFATSKKTTREA